MIPRHRHKNISAELSRRAAFGDNKLTNGRFDSDLSGWSATTGWSYSSGAAAYDGTDSDNSLSQSGVISTAKNYVLEFDLALSQGAIGFNDGTTTIFSGLRSAGSHLYSFLSTDTDAIFTTERFSALRFIGSLDNVSIRRTENLIVNGEMSSDRAWTDASTGAGSYSISGGELTLTSGANYLTDRGTVTQYVTCISGQKYRLKVTNSTAQVGRIKVSTDLAVTDIPANKTSYYYFAATSAGKTITIYSPASNSVSVSVTDIEIMQWPYN